ncbi:MAG: hypothetical protein M3Q99_10030 [Acidobacteriota bacterium]|nr:hypothetical protein [Acidobacteriota bacterium]
MNIKSRLKKLERVTDDSIVCACYPQRFETYIQDLGADAETNEPILSGKPTPDVCPDCLKPTEKKGITVQLVDGTTKDRFPDEWKANRNK